MSFPVLNQPVDPVAELSQQAADLDPNTMTPEKIAQIMLAAPLVRQMIESVEEEALRHGPGLRMDEGEDPACRPVDRMIGEMCRARAGGATEDAVQQRPMAQGAVEEEIGHAPSVPAALAALPCPSASGDRRLR